MKGLQQGFSDRLTALFAAAAKAGHTVYVGGGWRSYAGQVEAKRNATAKGRPKYAATPGRSNHGWGLAADLEYASASARNWIHSGHYSRNLPE